MLAPGPQLSREEQAVGTEGDHVVQVSGLGQAPYLGSVGDAAQRDLAPISIEHGVALDVGVEDGSRGGGERLGAPHDLSKIGEAQGGDGLIAKCVRWVDLRGPPDGRQAFEAPPELSARAEGARRRQLGFVEALAKAVRGDRRDGEEAH